MAVSLAAPLHQSFVDILRSHGAVIAPTIEWPFVGPCGRGVGLSNAGTAAKRGDVLMRIPRKLIYTAARALEVLHAPGSTEKDAHLAHLADEEEGTLLAYLLLYYAAHMYEPVAAAAVDPCPAVDDVSRAYIPTLPRACDFTLFPAHWSDDSIGRLPDAAASAEFTRVRDDVAAQFDSLTVWLQGSSSPRARAIACVSSEASFSWARTCVSTRSFICGFEMDDMFMCDGVADMLPIALAPCADGMNHCMEDDGAVGVNADTDWVRGSSRDEDALVVRAISAIAAGQEVLISYGDRSTAECVSSYAFLPSHVHAEHDGSDSVDGIMARYAHTRNPNDSVALPLHAVAAARTRGSCTHCGVVCACGAARHARFIAALIDMHALATGGGDDAAQLTVHVHDTPMPSSDALACFRALALSMVASAALCTCTSRNATAAHSDACVSAAYERLHTPLSRENELESLRVLIAALTDATSMLGDAKHAGTAALNELDEASACLRAAAAACDREERECARMDASAAAQHDHTTCRGEPWVCHLTALQLQQQHEHAATSLRAVTWHVIARAASYCASCLRIAAGTSAP